MYVLIWLLTWLLGIHARLQLHPLRSGIPAAASGAARAMEAREHLRRHGTYTWHHTRRTRIAFDLRRLRTSSPTSWPHMVQSHLYVVNPPCGLSPGPFSSPSVPSA